MQSPGTIYAKPGRDVLSQRFEPRREVAQHGRLVREGIAAELSQAPGKMPDHLDHVVNVALRVDAPGYRKADQLPGSRPFLARVRVPRAEHDRAHFHRADADAVI